ncbi:MAG: Na+/H+ antiporter NhaA, partial [Pseudomonadota bacterium]
VDARELPGIAAIGGMIAPALIFVLVIGGDPTLINGWAIPAATDIAFALGVLALLGPKAPLALKVFLLALAIIDDLGAILIIALFYTSKLSVMALLGGFAVLAILVALNLRGVKHVPLYVMLGLLMWVFVLKSGVHATLAGVALALTIPIVGDKEESPLEKLEHGLHPYVAYGIMPIFAFANAGVPLAGLGFDALVQPLTLAIALGLLFGKPIGIVGSVWLALKSGLVRLPDGVGMIQLVGVSALAGIGFTMSLFIGNLAFDDPQYAAGVRLGVLGGSILSATLGYLILSNSKVRADRQGSAPASA